MTPLLTEEKENNIDIIADIFIGLDNAKLLKLSLFGSYCFCTE